MNRHFRRNIIQFIKFCCVGGSGVLVNFAIFSLTLLLWGAVAGRTPHTAEYLANGLGFLISVLSNYYLNRRWTFRSSGSVLRELPKFFTVSVIAYLANLAVFTLGRHGLRLAPSVSQLIAIASVMPINFVLNKVWSFRHASTAIPDPE